MNFKTVSLVIFSSTLLAGCGGNDLLGEWSDYECEELNRGGSEQTSTEIYDVGKTEDGLQVYNIYQLRKHFDSEDCSGESVEESRKLRANSVEQYPDAEANNGDITVAILDFQPEGEGFRQLALHVDKTRAENFLCFGQVDFVNGHTVNFDLCDAKYVGKTIKFQSESTIETEI